MFVAGTHVPVRDPRLRTAVRTGVPARRVVGVVALVLGYAVAALVDTSHALLYAVLMASSSAALVLPTVDSLRLGRAGRRRPPARRSRSRTRSASCCSRW